MIRIHETRSVESPAEHVVAVTTDVTKLSSWLPEITGAAVLVQEGDISIIELRGPRLHGGRLVLECVRASAETVVFAEVDRYRGRGFSGNFSVRQDAGGRESLLSAEIQQDGSPFNFFSRRRLSRTLGEVLTAVLRRVAESSPQERASAYERRKILEVIRRNGKLFVCINGHSFELPSESPESGS